MGASVMLLGLIGIRLSCEDLATLDVPLSILKSGTQSSERHNDQLTIKTLLYVDSALFFDMP
jgi:hypothetical protein